MNTVVVVEIKLTTDEDHPEFYKAVISDGQSVVEAHSDRAKRACAFALQKYADEMLKRYKRF